MDYFKMYLRTIESEKQKFQAYVKKYGYKENLGQEEYRDFKDKINKNEHLSHAEKAELAGRFCVMVEDYL